MRISGLAGVGAGSTSSWWDTDEYEMNTDGRRRLQDRMRIQTAGADVMIG
jgi:hypothetical protein